MKTKLFQNTRVLFALLCAAAIPSAAGAVGITNGSFENDLADWNVFGNVLVKSSAPYVPTNGSKLVAFNSLNTLAPAGITHQLDTKAGHTYVIEFDVGNLGYNPQPLKLQVNVVGLVTTHIYNRMSVDVEIPGITGGRTRWVSKAITYSPSLRNYGEIPWISFSDVSTISDGLDLVLDNVRITEVETPEAVLEGGFASGFESGLDGWQSSGNVGIRNAPPYLATEGRNLAVFNAGNAPAGGYLSRNVATTPGGRYLLLFDVGNLSYNALHQRLGVMAGSYGYKQHLITDSIDIPGPGGGATAWIAASYEFTAVNDITDLSLYDASTDTFSTDLVLDNVRVIPIAPWGQFANGSFEYGFDAWTVEKGAGGVSVESKLPYLPTDGTKLAAFSSGNTGNYAHLVQTVDTIPGLTYQLVLDVGNLSYMPWTQSLRTLIDDGNYRLLNTAIMIPSTSTTGGTNWLRNQTYTFTARGNKTTFTFIDASGSTAGIDLVLDHIRLIPQ